MEHEDFRGLAKHIDRHNDYSSWEAHRWIGGPETGSSGVDRASDLPPEGAKYRSLDRWWFAPAYFLFTYVIRRGFLDGHAGRAYAFLKYVYFAEVRLKILELQSANAHP